ncbi:hypothetical protein KRR55_11490 [Paeniglutamicibacter sp. ABSL32-1]|uniref:hypothetical protein n=1 Tax=Paeniglutamicibacter quisquiliarum TaxID=2849498 RepID=UPI001C2D834E|nr:hypothetical protein [Paeniglutamicibacter quisquiliarum]MBV1779734.1 hypothetical protein [Paeniglutamicibacter quisquiliarum]
MAGQAETLLILEVSERTAVAAGSGRHSEGIGPIGAARSPQPAAHCTRRAHILRGLCPHIADAVERHTMGDHRPAVAALLEHRALQGMFEYVF